MHIVMEHGWFFWLDKDMVQINRALKQANFYFYQNNNIKFYNVDDLYTMLRDRTDTDIVQLIYKKLLL